MTAHCEINISPIPAFNDNYIWALTHKDIDSNPMLNSLALVDPGDAKVCITYIEQHDLQLTDILITHHHADHVGGIDALLNYAKDKNWSVKVYGPKNEKIPHCDELLSENDIVSLEGINASFRVIELPGHTLGHISYINDQALFCGDTLFSGGCGRVFEGTHLQMYNALQKLSDLPENTLVYCAHEYTQANLNFALEVDKDNQALIEYNTQVAKLRSLSKSTIPSSIGLEKKINPFLRCHTNSIQLSAKTYDNKTEKNPVSAFASIRRWKDQF
jgi:hydroxyacylglutathione hydrolase